VEDLLGKKVNELSDLTDAIDLVFERHGHNAVAVKNQAAYTRPLHFARWEDAVAEHTLDFCIRKKWLIEKGERKPLEDFLTHYTIDKSAKYGLPYKFHTGMTSGCNSTLYYTVRDHAADCAYLCTEHPDAKFVFMHMFYPYQHEALALAKQYPNAYIDMCWSWMLNPEAAVKFLKEAVTSLPLHKILLFGGDVSYIELLPGHADVARQGIARALSELVEEKWLTEKELPAIIDRLFTGNAKDLFGI
jgi:predicted TIM-barrel fold metal-dependent hydrolase